MIPKTKLEKRVFELSQRLPGITEKQKAWGINHCLDCFGFLSKGITTCECGHSFNNIEKATRCPSCGNKIRVVETYQLNNSAYYGVYTSIEGFQVMRLFWVKKIYSKSEPMNPFISEVVQNWISPEGKRIIIGKSVNPWGLCYDRWHFMSDMEVKSYHHRYDERPFKVHPTRKYSETILRNGFTGKFHGMNPVLFFQTLITDSRFETLLKAGQDKMLSSRWWIESYWPTIKILLRNKYIISDIENYKDYIELLKYFKRDLLNPKYVCPDDLMQEHDRLVKKKRSIQKKQKLEEMKAELAALNETYLEQKGKYLGVSFLDKDLSVSVIENVEDFMDEGDELEHCVFTNEYFKKPNSLILSAKIGHQRLETIEVRLSDFRIYQARGLKNKPTTYHRRIVRLINKNMDSIKSLSK